MRVYSRIWKTGIVLIVAVMMLAGCTRRGVLERLNASQPEVIIIDMQATPVQTAMPAPNDGTQATQAGSTTNNNQPTAPPKTATSTDGSDVQLEQLMDELETALNELEASTTKADQDALLDSTLAALGK